jgi:predicted Zn-ribbon and HTH transcriptional regulator
MQSQKSVKAKCKRCGYEWETRKREPRSCPMCHSYRWTQPKAQDETMQES